MTSKELNLILKKFRKQFHTPIDWDTLKTMYKYKLSILPREVEIFLFKYMNE